MKNNFSNNLKHLRVQNGLTQEELAKKMDKNYSTIGKWENGSRSPTMLDVLKISELFNISLQNLIYSDVSIKKEDELETLFSNNIDKLNNDDKETIKFIIEKRKKVDENE